MKRDGDHFHAVRDATPRHVNLDASDRRRLHPMLRSLHRAIHAGREDVAGFFARSAARLCRKADRDG